MDHRSQCKMQNYETCTRQHRSMTLSMVMTFFSYLTPRNKKKVGTNINTKNCTQMFMTVLLIYFYPAPLATIKEAQCLMDLFAFWRQCIPHLDVLLWLVEWPEKLLVLRGGQKNRRFCNRASQNYSRYPVTWARWSSRSNGACSVGGRDAVWSFRQGPID